MNDLLTKIEKIDDKLNSINITLAEQHISLKEHMARSAAAEKRLDLVETTLTPIKNHILIFNTVIKIIMFLFTIIIPLKALHLF